MGKKKESIESWKRAPGPGNPSVVQRNKANAILAIRFGILCRALFVATTYSVKNTSSKLGMFEICRKNLTLKLFFVCDEKRFAVLVPSRNFRIASVNHSIGFYVSMPKSQSKIREGRNKQKQRQAGSKEQIPNTVAVPFC